MLLLVVAEVGLVVGLESAQTLLLLLALLPCLPLQLSAPDPPTTAQSLMRGDTDTVLKVEMVSVILQCKMRLPRPRVSP